VHKKPQVDPDVYKDSKAEKKPEESKPEEKPPAEEKPQEGGQEGGVPGGVAGGVVGGVVGGIVGGVLGGTGTALVPDAKPPTFTTLSIGDPNLDQTSCPSVGQPPYPQEARAAKVEAKLVARCIVEPSGSLTCSLVKSHPFFETSIKAYLSSVRVKPFTSHGTPVRVSCNYPFSFRLE
jgi:protein TonB